MILSKITAHDQKDAPRSRNMTILTMRSAWRKSPRIERSCGTAPPSGTALMTSPCMSRDHPCGCVVEGKKRRAERRRKPLRPAVAADRRDLKGKQHQALAAAPHLLIELETGLPERAQRGRDDEVVVEPRRRAEVERAAAHD